MRRVVVEVPHAATEKEAKNLIEEVLAYHFKTRFKRCAVKQFSKVLAYEIRAKGLRVKVQSYEKESA